jgi:hypothetical protein
VPLRSQRGERADTGAKVDPAEQVDHCLKHRLVGLGWGVHGDPPPTTLAETYKRIREQGHGWAPGIHIIRRFAAAKEGSLIWTRHPDGTWLLGKMTGDWRPDYSAEAWEVDVHQVRDCAWAPQRILSEEVPGDVIRRFSGRGSSFSEMHAPLARAYSNWLYADLTGGSVKLPKISNADVLRELLDPFDVEDLVYVYLQAVRNYLVLPASRRTDTAAYEYALIERDTKQLAVTQIKSGDTPVDLSALAATVGDDKIGFAYATSGQYDGDGGKRVECLSDDELLGFAKSHPDLLPPRVKRWLQFAQFEQEPD